MTMRFLHLGILNRVCFLRRDLSTTTTGIVDKRALVANIPKAYDPALVEEKIIERWTTSRVNGIPDCSTPESDIFRMILPPPNITGRLHLGHAVNVTIQDLIARWHLMRGKKIHWIPGFDHAGIATQSVFNRKFKNTPEDNVTPEMQKFADANKESITKQLKRLTPLLDWDSSYFTLDEKHTDIVKEAFIELLDNGVIRRGEGIVNWSCALQSSIADIEVETVDFQGRITLKVPGHEKLVECGILYYFVYPLENSDEKVVVATSRPETMFGDVALAINPMDSKNSKFIGKRAVNPLNGKILPIIGDNRVKLDFGSGVLKVTPAHDKLDFLIGQAHNLQPVKIFNSKGLLNSFCGDYMALGRFTARLGILQYLQENGSLIDTKEYSGSLGLCSRSGDIIESIILPHWYFKTEILSAKLIDAIQNKEFKIVPAYCAENLLHNLNKVQDWCISRQIKWGHSIPAYYHIDHTNVWVGAKNLNEAKTRLEDKLKIHIQDTNLILQDKDVLDTWFSSALIPLAISGWPYSKEEKEIHLMETGSDIILFWVWKMVVMNLALVDRFPFRKVLLHGIVSDHYGRKMSKSRGNVIDPMDIIYGKSKKDLNNEAEISYKSGELDQNEYKLRITALDKEFPNGFHSCGTDALRISLLSQDIFKQGLKLDMLYLENCKHFCNKIWQSMKFFIMNSDQGINHPTEVAKPTELELSKSKASQWILARLFDLAYELEVNFPNNQFHTCFESIRRFFVLEFCDIYIELVKNDLKKGINAESHILVMRYVLDSFLKLSHPFIPFVTEEVWKHLTEDKQGLLLDSETISAAQLAHYQNPSITETMKKGLIILKEVRAMKARYEMKKDSKFYIETPWGNGGDEEFDFLHNLIPGATMQFSPPSKSEKLFVISHLFSIGGKACKVSSPKDEKMMDKLIGVDTEKLLRMQKKLIKYKQQFDSKDFQQFAKPEVKDKLKKKINVLQFQIEEFNKGKTTTAKPAKPVDPLIFK